MGYEIPAGIGVRMSQPTGEVFVYLGDGGYLMNPTELVTSIQENLKITLVISENHGFQSIYGLQMARAGHTFATEFMARDATTGRLEGAYLEIDFAKNAESMGARTWYVTTPDDLRKALSEARAETRCCVIVAKTEPHRVSPASGIWWDVEVAEVSEDGVIVELRVEYENERKELQRFYY